MKRMTEDNDSLALAGLAFHVLVALAHGPSHGYAIGKDVQEQSGGRLDPTTGALYQALRRLTEADLIAPVDGPADVDPRRKYFTLTTRGRKAAAAEARRLDVLLRAARKRKLYPQRA